MNFFKFYQKRNFGGIKTDSNVSLISPETSVELSEVSVDFSERNASVAKTRNFELLCKFILTLTLKLAGVGNCRKFDQRLDWSICGPNIGAC
jgi:hypothetical protein